MSTITDVETAAHRLEEAGFNERQAKGAAELFVDMLDERATKDATATSLMLIAGKLESMDSRQKADTVAIRGDIAGIRGDIASMQGNISGIRGDISGMQGDIASMQGDIVDIRGDISGVRGDIARLEAMMAQMLEGQAILIQNDMELKRELAERR